MPWSAWVNLRRCEVHCKLVDWQAPLPAYAPGRPGAAGRSSTSHRSRPRQPRPPRRPSRADRPHVLVAAWRSLEMSQIGQDRRPLIMSVHGWESRGKTVRGLIEELRTFENQDLKVEIAFEPGEESFPISLVGNDGGKCILFCLAGRSKPSA